MGLQGDAREIASEMTLLELSGNLTFEEADTFRSMIRVLLERGVKKLILEMSGVLEIDSLGGTSLVRSFFCAREANACLCVARASPPVERLFKSARVDTLIPFFSTIEAASEHLTKTEAGPPDY